MPERVPVVLVSKDTGFRYYGNVWGDRVCGWSNITTANRVLTVEPVGSDYEHIVSLERNYEIIQLTRIE